MGQHKNNPTALYFKNNREQVNTLYNGEVSYKAVDYEATLVPLSNIFGETAAIGIKGDLSSQVKAGECHRNAWHFAMTFPDNVEYCEGLLVGDGSMSPIYHCFNRVQGKFIDITQEIGLKHDLSSGSWNRVIVKRIFAAREIQKVFEKEGKSFITLEDE